MFNRLKKYFEPHQNYTAKQKRIEKYINSKRLVKRSVFVEELIYNNEPLITKITKFINESLYKWSDFVAHKNELEVYLASIFTSDMMKLKEEIDNMDVVLKEDESTDFDTSDLIKILTHFVYKQITSLTIMLTQFSNANIDMFQLIPYGVDTYADVVVYGNEEVNFVLSNLCSQKINSKDIRKTYMYDGFKYDIEKQLFAPIKDDSFPDYFDTPFSISIFKSVMYMSVIDTLWILEQLYNNQDNRFVFFRFHFSKGDEAGHFAMIVFDTVFETVQLLDPNGVSNYFDDHLTNDNLSFPYFMDMMRNYFELFNNICNLKYTFQVEHQYPCAINITTSTTHSYDKGHCVPLTLMLIYLMTQHKQDLQQNFIKDLGCKFDNMSYEQLEMMRYNFAGHLNKIIKQR